MDDWVKLAVRYYADPKVTGLPDADTELMFVRGLARAGEIAHGGFIPESDLPLLTRRRRWGSCVKALVAAGLWSPVDGGYRITAWADWQSAADALAARRQADRERQRKHRQKSRDNEDVSRDVTGADLEKEITNPPNPPPSGGNDTHVHNGQHVNCRACGTNRRKPKPPEAPPASHRLRDAQEIVAERKNGYEPPPAESVEQIIATTRQRVQHPHADQESP